MRFDPNEYDKENAKPDQGERRQYKPISEGLKTLHGLTFERWTAKSGTQMLKVWFVILKDYTKNGDEGEVIARNFALTPKAMFLWSRFCKALGWSKAHDLENDDDINAIIGSGPLNSKLVPNEYNGKTTMQPDEFAAFDGKEASDWDDLLSRGKVSVERLQAKIAEKRGDSAPPSYSAPSGGNDDIPF